MSHDRVNVDELLTELREHEQRQQNTQAIDEELLREWSQPKESADLRKELGDARDDGVRYAEMKYEEMKSLESVKEPGALRYKLEQEQKRLRKIMSRYGSIAVTQMKGFEKRVSDGGTFAGTEEIGQALYSMIFLGGACGRLRKLEFNVYKDWNK